MTEPIYGRPLGQVCLRPANLIRLEELVGAGTAVARREREREAAWLALEFMQTKYPDLEVVFPEVEQPS
ncbi:MAG: hypothetical protein KDA79_14000 [Planctomycetaceae bacterium]|nr:hypothetical protein [Planctomycetaceae bacterium]